MYKGVTLHPPEAFSSFLCLTALEKAAVEDWESTLSQGSQVGGVQKLKSKVEGEGAQTGKTREEEDSPV